MSSETVFRVSGAADRGRWRVPVRTCATNGCGNLVRRRGVRCTECRRYLRSANELERQGKTPDIKPLPPDTVEQIVALIEEAITLLRANPNNTALALRSLHAAVNKAEPWRTLRAEIRRTAQTR